MTPLETLLEKVDAIDMYTERAAAIRALKEKGEW